MAARAAGTWIGYHARVSPGRTALHDLASGRRLSYAELDDRIARLAGALAGRHGVRPGDRVAMLSRNRDGGLGVPHRAAGLARGRAQPVREPGPVRGRHRARHAGLRPGLALDLLTRGSGAVGAGGGRVTIIDRIKDMYISGGENVYPAEIEDVLYQHPAVAGAAVIGVPDERWGETGAAWLVLAKGAEASPGDIRAWARTRLAAFKVPRDVHLVDALPRNATGKILRAELRRLA